MYACVNPMCLHAFVYQYSHRGASIWTYVDVHTHSHIHVMHPDVLSLMILIWSYVSLWALPYLGLRILLLTWQLRCQRLKNTSVHYLEIVVHYKPRKSALAPAWRCRLASIHLRPFENSTILSHGLSLGAHNLAFRAIQVN